MIDSHLHFWKYKAAGYPWITADMVALQRDHCLVELEHELEFSGVDQVIAVQSRRCDRENHFLIELARKSGDLVAGVVGWAPLESCELRVFLDQYVHEPLLVGVREIIAGTPGAQFLDNPDFDQGIAELARHDLAFDLLVDAQQLRAAIAFADRHPNQRMVLNHCGCPQLEAGAFSQSWAHAMRELARRPHVYCKLSGLTTALQTGMESAAIATRHSQLLRPYVDSVLHAFGPQRIMYGSNWPVCNLTTTYPAWLTTVDDLMVALSEDERACIYRETALAFYRTG